MHDETELTVGRARRVLAERILPAVHGEREAVEIGWAPLPGEPVPPAEGLALAHSPCAVGTAWGPAWGTTWFRVRGTVPPRWRGRTVELLVDLGFDPRYPGFQAEALAYLPDGTPLKSVNPRNRFVTVAREASGGEAVEIHLEAASNPVLLGDDPFRPTAEGDVLTASREPLYRLRQLELAVLEPQVLELSLDVDVLLQLQAELPAGPRRMRVLQALDDALDRLDLQDVAGTAGAARDALRGVLGERASASEHRLSAVGHAHIDSAWLWPVRETVRKVARTAASMCDLIEGTADFVYGMSSAQQYAWIEEHRPEVFARVREAVAAGRFLPLGGMWVESDTVMPCGESLVRQFAYGQRYFRERFGVTCRGVWLPDSFGYSPALPQLLRRAGFEWFLTQKISWNQTNRFPHHTFDWEGIDGSRVLAHFPPVDTYNAQLSGEELARASRQFREARLASGSVAPVGYGDGGGGTTREMVGRAARLADLEGSPRVAWEHPDAFFERARRELPDPAVWVGELYLELHRATLTSQHGTKRGNRRCEHLLVEAEAWCAAASVLAAAPYPADAIAALWQQVLLQQFHDILPGTSIAWVHREAVAQYERVEREAGELVAAALRALAGEGDVELVANGSAERPVSGPAAGVAGYGIAAAPPVPPERVVPLPDADGGLLLDNGVVRVRLDAAGLLTSAVDLRTGTEVLTPGGRGNLLQLHQDFPNMWDAWDVDRHYRNRVTDLVALDALHHGTEADGTAVVTVTRSFSASRLVQRIRLAPGSDTVLFDTDIDWHEAEKFLKAAFPLDVRADRTLAETQFGHVARPTHTNTSWDAARFEVSMHRWALAAEEGGPSAALVNDSLHGHDVTRSVTGSRVTTTLRLSLLRAPRFPDPATDQGPQRLVYGLVVGAGVADAVREGTLLNTPPRRLRGAHPVAPLVAAEGVTVSSVKLAEDGSGDVVVRVHEALGRRASGRVTVRGGYREAREVTLVEDPVAAPEPLRADLGDDAAVLGLQLTPFEVRTLRLARR